MCMDDINSVDKRSKKTTCFQQLASVLNILLTEANADWKSIRCSVYSR